jgi:predicted PurR-regulated permease PerM
MSETKPKKMVRRSVAIALGIICIVLVAGLGVVLFMGYSPTFGSSVTSLQSQLNDLNATYNKYLSTHGHNDSDYNSLSTQNTNLQNQVNDLNNTLNLAKSTVAVNNQTISQPQDSWFNWTFKAQYAGYLLVQVYNSTILNPLAELVYSYHGINYDQQTEVGTIEGAAFPIMPSYIEVRVGNGLTYLSIMLVVQL